MLRQTLSWIVFELSQMILFLTCFLLNYFVGSVHSLCEPVTYVVGGVYPYMEPPNENLTGTLVGGVDYITPFSAIHQIALSSSESTLYVTDKSNHRIREVTVTSRSTRPLAGFSSCSFFAGIPAQV